MGFCHCKFFVAVGTKKLTSIPWVRAFGFNNKPNSIRVAGLDRIEVVVSLEAKVKLIAFWLEVKINFQSSINCSKITKVWVFGTKKKVHGSILLLHDIF